MSRNPVPTNDIELDPVEAANLAEDSARWAAEGQGITARRRDHHPTRAAGTAQNGWSP